jgi:hypothetical protein
VRLGTLEECRTDSTFGFLELLAAPPLVKQDS